MSLMLAVSKARDAAACLRGARSGGVKKGSDAPAALSGNVTTADLATGGMLPAATAPKRRFRLPESDSISAVQKAWGEYVYRQKADSAPETLTIVHGLTIVIDRPAGFVQTKEDASGAVLWTRTYSTPYGYLPGTAGGDGDELDVFVGPDTASEDVWWFSIIDDAGKPDEYKIVACVADAAAALAIILAHIPAMYVAPGCAMTTIGQIKALLGQDQREGEEAVEQIAKSLDRAEKMERVKKAFTAVTKFGPVARPTTMHPTLPLGFPNASIHPANTAPLTGTYPDPNEVGGWLGWIEDPEETWIAFVNVDALTLLWTERVMDGPERGGCIGDPIQISRPDLAREPLALETPGVGEPTQVRALKSSVSEELRYILGIVLEPEVVDGQKEIYSADEIRKSAWMWLRDFRNIDLEHKLYVNDLVEVVESYVTTCDMEIGGQRVIAGTWLLGTVVKDDGMWADIKSGKLTGYSINGFSKKKPA